MPAETGSLLRIPAGPALSFSDACLGDEGIRDLVTALDHRRDITSLDLRGCHVHAPGAAALKVLLTRSGAGRLIGSLSLEWNALGTSDAGPRALAGVLAANVSLTTLDLRNNRIGSTGIASLADGLRTNGTLVTLDLRWNSAGSSGGLALEHALAENASLLRLPLQGNRVPDDCQQKINQLLARNGSRKGGGAEAGTRAAPPTAAVRRPLARSRSSARTQTASAPTPAPRSGGRRFFGRPGRSYEWIGGPSISLRRDVGAVPSSRLCSLRSDEGGGLPSRGACAPERGERPSCGRVAS